jgi:methionine-rich copper-binding protein CopC
MSSPSGPGVEAKSKEVRRLARIQVQEVKELKVKITRTQQFLAVFALLGFLGMSTASANSLITTSPISGSTVVTAPTSVTLTAQIALLADANEIVVTDAAGVRVDDGTITINDVSATIGLKPLVDSGIYRVTYILYSEADAPLEGSFTFNYSTPTVISPIDSTPTPKQTQTPASSSWGTNIFIIFMLFMAFLVLIALALYARKLFRER